MQRTTVTADYGASAEKLNGAVSWMLQDGQGSTRQLLNSSQTVVAAYISDSFGNSVGGSGSSSNPFIWNGGSGYYSDAESGLQKVGARFYDPAVGRWISQDTLLVAGSAGDSQAVNRYAYCAGNPVACEDPGGQDPGAVLFIIAIVFVLCDIALGIHDIEEAKRGAPNILNGPPDSAGYYSQHGIPPEPNQSPPTRGPYQPPWTNNGLGPPSTFPDPNPPVWITIPIGQGS